MNKNLINLKSKLETLPEDIRVEFLALFKKVDKDLTISEFKLMRTEKMRKTISYFLDESVAELELKNSELNKTLEKLQSTQTQLIHSEKMASLGELTAGIAHEIQNPLNFVNNFSDVSGELIDEAIEEMSPTDFDSAVQPPPLSLKNIEEVKGILTDLKSNLEKIHHHGDRASSIVKGMLAHSRTSSGTKELTDINALCDEYMRLSYHGMRAKDKTFKADFTLDLEEGLKSIKVIPQDLGRVILNILNNSFYTVDKKFKSANIKDYKPMVELTTQQINESKIRLSIKDNGQGMSKELQNKIFQPFFTTKPTGQGTGLGMSISYDIITKGHGGEIEVESKEGEGTTFIITIPIAS